MADSSKHSEAAKPPHNQAANRDLLLCDCDGFWHVSIPDDSPMLNNTQYIGNMEEAVLKYIEDHARYADEGIDLAKQDPEADNEPL